MRKYYSPYNFWLEFICLKEWELRNTVLNASMIIKHGAHF